MPNFQTIVLDTATPQLRAPGTGDGYSFDSGATNLGTWTTTGLTLSTGSLTLTPGTANGVLYLNGSKVATSGSALTFDGTNLALTGSNPIYRVPDAGGYLFTADGNTGIFLQQTGTPQNSFFVGGSERMRLDASGSLLLGTTASVTSWTSGRPMDLQIAKSGAIFPGISSYAYSTVVASGGMVTLGRSRGSFGTLSATSSGDGLGYLAFEGVNSSNALAGAAYIAGFQDGAAGATNIPGRISFFTSSGSANPAERLRIDSSGNLGIGTTSPAATLSISKQSTALSGTGNSYGLYLYPTSSGLAYIDCLTGGVNNTSLAFRTYNNGTYNTLTLDNAGNLGLGVTPVTGNWTPLFQVKRSIFNGGNSDRTEVAYNYYRTGGVNTYIATDFATLYDQISGQHRWFTAPSGTAGNAITFTQAMTLDSSGNLGIGTTSPGALLDVYSATTSNYVRVGSASTFSAGLSIAANANTHLTSGSLVYQDSSNRLNLLNYANAALRLGTNNTFRVSVPAAGGIVVGTAALATNATDGFLYVPTCAGTPTGTPTTQTGTAPIVIDTTNNKLYFYSSGVWRDAGP